MIIAWPEQKLSTRWPEFRRDTTALEHCLKLNLSRMVPEVSV